MADFGINIPLTDIDGRLSDVEILGSASFPSITIYSDIKTAVISGRMTMPLVSLTGRIPSGWEHLTLSESIPAFTCSGYSGANADNEIPSLTIYSIGLSGIVGHAELTLYLPTLSTTASSPFQGNFDVGIPSITITATGYLGVLGSLDKPIPALQIEANSFVNCLANLSRSIPAVTLSATSNWMGTNYATLTLPSITIDARTSGLIAEIITLAMNTKNFGLSQYSSYNYNSLCMFNGHFIGAKSSGVYELEGSNDAGNAILWKLRLPKLNLEDSKLREIYIYGTLNGDTKAVVETPEGERYEYDAEPVSENDDRIRIKVGKGIRSKYLVLELFNEDNFSITIDKIQGEGMKL